MDINGDGTVGGKPAHPSNSNHYGSVGYATNPHQSSDGGLMNKLENVTHMDLNSYGRIGGNYNQPLNYNHEGHKQARYIKASSIISVHYYSFLTTTVTTLTIIYKSNDGTNQSWY
ncbi:unnamed protein product [Rotaria socialis]